MDKLKLFVIWLGGYMDACGPQLNEEQTAVIKAKLDAIFIHEAGHVEEPTVLGLPSSYDHPQNNGQEVMRC